MINHEQIRAYGETFTIDEKAHAVSKLSEWFIYKTWTVQEGLLLLVGIDPYDSEDLFLTESGFESKPNPTWARITARKGLSTTEFDNGMPLITGLVTDLFQIELLSQLLNLWARHPLHTLTGRHEPSYYRQWADGERCLPFWYEWALDANLFQRGIDSVTHAPAQTTATPAPVVDIGTSVGVEPYKAGSPPVEQGLPTKDIAACFGDCYYSADNWPKRLSGTAWLKTACIGKGEIGGASAVWNPLTLAQLMHSKTKGDKAKEKLMKTLNSRFKRNPVLGLWRDAFDEYFETHCATD